MDTEVNNLFSQLHNDADHIDTSWQEPLRFSLRDSAHRQALRELIDTGSVIAIRDNIKEAVQELYDIEYPHEKDLLVKTKFDEFQRAFDEEYGTWVYFPWSRYLVRFPEQSDLRKLRTSRNRDLVTEQEQQRLYDASVAVFGLSVGSNVVDSLLLQGIGGTLIVADMDYLEPSNLNRIRAPYQDVGLSKIDNIAKRISETDPYIVQVHYHDGLTEHNLEEIMNTHRPAVLVDEMDQLEMKVKLRQRARRAAVAVISAADDGNDTLVDIERYDLDHDKALFNGIIPADILQRIERGEVRDRKMLGMMIGRYFIGPDHIPLRMFQSLDRVGKTLPSWPQLGGAAVLAGVVSAYCARQIILGKPLREGRYVIGPESTLSLEHEDDEHQTALSDYRNKLGSL